jgi:autotransporter adhesin
MSPVVHGTVDPLENTLNSLLGALNVLLPILPAPLSFNSTTLLNNAAAGSDINLSVLARDGTVLGPSSQCDSQASSYTLATDAGLSIGGNQITGLGQTNHEANAGEINSIALGNDAVTAASATRSIAFGNNASVGNGALGSIAFGANSSVTAAHSIAIGDGSIASRGAASGAFGEVSVGAPGSERQITNVAAGTQLTDAATLGQLNAVQALIPTNPVRYDTAGHGVVTLDGAGGTVIAGVASGTVGAGSTQAVNGAQLFATNQNVATAQSAASTAQSAANTAQSTADTALAVANNGVQYSDAAHTSVNLNNGGQSVRVSNLAAGSVTATSTDAVNGAQLFGMTQAMTSLQASAADGVYYDDPSHGIVTFGGGGASTRLTNVTAGTLNATSSDAVTGAQLFATNQQVQNNTTAITNLAIQVGNGSTGPVQYSDAAAPTTPNGGTPTNDLTLVGGASAPVALHNVAGGTLAAGSTDAVNGGQLFATNQNVIVAQATADTALATANNGVQYSNGARTRVNLNNGGAAVTMSNLANGAVTANSSDAVNGALLFATNVNVAAAAASAGAAQTTANTALTTANNGVQYSNAQHTLVSLNGGGAAARVTNVANGAITANSSDAINGSQLFGLSFTTVNAVSYDADASGNRADTVTLSGGTPGAGVVVRNVGAGTAPTDAVNVAQMNTAAANAVSMANAYTDSRITALGFDLRRVARDANAGSAAALAAAALPQAQGAGRYMLAGGVGTYRGRASFAAGASYRAPDGRSVFRLGVSYDSSQHVGANAGAGFEF